MVFNKLCAIN